MQYTKRDWRNRNKIKTPNGLKWLTIPVEVKGKFHQKIKDTEVSDSNWATKHFETLKHNYSKSRYYRDIIPFLEDLYGKAELLTTISEINTFFIKKICNWLNITTKITYSWDYKLIGDNPTERLMNICMQANATEYYTGPAAKKYMDEFVFHSQNISLKYFNYSDYPEYNQLFGDFEHGVSVLDMLFNLGHESIEYFKFAKT